MNPVSAIAALLGLASSAPSPKFPIPGHRVNKQPSRGRTRYGAVENKSAEPWRVHCPKCHGKGSGNRSHPCATCGRWRPRKLFRRVMRFGWAERMGA